ncbi:DNA phosphorothioation-dependent restriction protein DptF [Shewanella frigidimarina]|uniref:DNA phosphorothioation-dependent restriction protein DptF n=1 Tax=Shewanella frigidimarina TaxID=56812 RepID=A0A106C2M8_SHEFR|nr:DNA phosphorothioation-dependent restriction protein DptF [Shewanella frigidimarina]KVX03119.1 DNA phosphorothioation-dependent restriction protein DptF [Shewanella frigidimarina]
MRLKEALSVMSMASPYAVSTERNVDVTNLHHQIKKYLYIEMPIEKSVDKCISSFGANDKKILFLCGSSGDGKSELLTKAKLKFGTRVKFHLDATHSFDPNENAIQTLDKLFEEYQLTSTPLVVGINTGMLGNYAEEGVNEFFKQIIKHYLESGATVAGVSFISFEDYPKFHINEDGFTAEFAEKLIKKITATENNIIRQSFDKDKIEHTDAESVRLHANYEILSLPNVQKTIVDLLFKARLIRGQFLTARSLLDFIFMLLTGPDYLFDNLFSGGDNELASKIIDFDPAHLRTKNIDRFILANDLSLPDSKFSQFKEDLKSLGIKSLKSSLSYLRLFYILKTGRFSNDYHHLFVGDFNDSLIEKYLCIYQLHRDFDDSAKQKKSLKDFYNNTLRAAIRKYNNRNAPNLDKNHYLIKELNGYQLVAKLDVRMDTRELQQLPSSSKASFTACIKVEDQSLTVPININLLNLMQKIVDGYRPNKHDKNTVVLLDELIKDIASVANDLSTLYIVKGSQQLKVTKVEDDEIEVSGM